MASGLQLMPMMLGMLMTSIASGRVISAWGRYKAFPIAGTAIMTIGLLMLSQLSIDYPVWRTSVDAFVLGLGLGMVMQVLVLAAQNSVISNISASPPRERRCSDLWAARWASRFSVRSSPTGCTRI